MFVKATLRDSESLKVAFTDKFRVSVISEPHPVPEARALFPDDFGLLDTFPSFLFFVIEAA
jgi:hypothetical protein